LSAGTVGAVVSAGELQPTRTSENAAKSAANALGGPDEVCITTSLRELGSRLGRWAGRAPRAMYFSNGQRNGAQSRTSQAPAVAVRGGRLGG
jgi:hypothetical protein